MVVVESFEWFLEQAKNSPDDFVASLDSERMISRPQVLIQAIEAARSCVPACKLVPVLQRLLIKGDNSIRFCILNTLGTYYDAANVEVEYLAVHDPDPACRALASRIRQDRQVAVLVASYVAMCIFMVGWAIFSVFGHGYTYLFVASCLFVIRFALMLMEVDVGVDS